MRLAPVGSRLVHVYMVRTSVGYWVCVGVSACVRAWVGVLVSGVDGWMYACACCVCEGDDILPYSGMWVCLCY